LDPPANELKKGKYFVLFLKNNFFVNRRVGNLFRAGFSVGNNYPNSKAGRIYALGSPLFPLKPGKRAWKFVRNVRRGLEKAFFPAWHVVCLL
jgi:hypothetical protein